MASASAGEAAKPRIAALIDARLASDGSAGHPYCGSDALLRGPDAARNLADAVHFLCTLHGRHPGVIDLAAERNAEPAARAWLEANAAAFAVERRLLARLAVAVGPVPGTPGGSASEAAVVSQRGALATLGCSERSGCALGAAFGLAADWHSVRAVLDAASRRVGIEAPPCQLSGPDEICATAETVAGPAPFERALLFGTEQVLIQHHGLWSLLEAREQARRGN